MKLNQIIIFIIISMPIFSYDVSLQEQLSRLREQLTALSTQLNAINYVKEYEKYIANVVEHEDPNVIKKYGGIEKYKEALIKSMTLHEFIEEKIRTQQQEEADKQQMVLFKPEQQRLMRLLNPTEQELNQSMHMLYTNEYASFNDVKSPIRIRQIILNIPLLRRQNQYAKQLFDKSYDTSTNEEKNNIVTAIKQESEKIREVCSKEVAQLIAKPKSDNIVMISLGSYVGPFLHTWEFDQQTITRRNQDAINQQIPDFIKKAAEQYPTASIRIFLFDPLFYDDYDTPRGLRIEGGWNLIKKTDNRIQLYEKNNIHIMVIPCIFNDALASQFREYIKALFEYDGALFIYYYSADFLPDTIGALWPQLNLLKNPNRIITRNFDTPPDFMIEKKDNTFYIVPRI